MKNQKILTDHSHIVINFQLNPACLHTPLSLSKITRKFNYFLFFYELSNCPKGNFEPIARRQAHSPDVNHCTFSNLIWNSQGALWDWVPKSGPTHQWDFHQEPSNQSDGRAYFRKAGKACDINKNWHILVDLGQLEDEMPLTACKFEAFGVQKC